MVNELLEELKNKIKVAAEYGNHVSIGLRVKSSNKLSLKHVINADCMLVLSDCISIEEDNFNLNFNYGKDIVIQKEEIGFEENYTIQNDILELYLVVIGT